MRVVCVHVVCVHVVCVWCVHVGCVGMCVWCVCERREGERGRVVEEETDRGQVPDGQSAGLSSHDQGPAVL